MERIGRYQITGELGRGAMGVVYRAQDPAIGRVIAIKTIRLSELSDEGERERMRERLFREAQSAGILSHPNIVTIYDIAEEHGLAYIFMEYVDGPTLEELLSRGDLPPNELLLGVLRQTASALDYAHRKGIVHRDIKPANIMLQDGTQAKIADFGVARIVSQQMTQSGVMMGTPNYMSPEQIQGHAVDGRADQFSLAVIAYEVLSGEKPFAADYMPTLLYKIVREEPVAPQRVNPSLAPGVEPVLRRALAKAPEERYPTCTEFVAALVSALGTKPGWAPLPRGASQSMPTLDGTQRAPAAAPAVSPVPRSRAAATVRGEDEENADRSGRLLKRLALVLAGIGLIGLALLGAQRMLFHSDNAEPAAQGESAVRQPDATPPQDAAPKSLPAAPVTEPAPEPQHKPSAFDSGRDTRRTDEHKTPNSDETSGANAGGAEQMVQFVTDPPGASITVDGSHSCKTPCMLPLPGGRHSMNVQMEGYRTYPKVFNSPQESDIFLKLTKTAGTISVTSAPDGATVFLNGEEQSAKTPALFHLPPGNYKVRVVHDGTPLDFDVELHDGELISRNVRF